MRIWLSRRLKRKMHGRSKETRGIYREKNWHTLVYGGFGDGMLGAVALKAYENGADIISILPKTPRAKHTEFKRANMNIGQKTKGNAKDCKPITRTPSSLCHVV